MIQCQSCGNKNPEISQYCDECGEVLGLRNSRQSEAEPQAVSTSGAEKPVFQSANVTSVGIPPIGDELVANEDSDLDGNHRQIGVHAMLVIERGEAIGTEFNLVAQESHIGRWDADNGIFPDVDLDAFDIEAKVSRRHARIIQTSQKYLIEDLGSTNGTYINRGKRLIPGNAQILKDGDEIIVGKTFLRFNVQN